MRLGAVEVVVPDTEHGEEDGQVLLERRGAEVLVHTMRTLEELLEVIEADDKRDGETNRGPEGVAAADPVPERKHVLLGDAKLGDLGGVGGERDEVLRDVRLVLGGGEEPVASGDRVRDGLLGGEGLGGDDEERGLGVAELRGLGEVGAVDVGDEAQGLVPGTIVLEGFGDHDGTTKEERREMTCQSGVFNNVGATKGLYGGARGTGHFSALTGQNHRCQC